MKKIEAGWLEKSLKEKHFVLLKRMKEEDGIKLAIFRITEKYLFGKAFQKILSEEKHL